MVPTCTKNPLWAFRSIALSLGLFGRVMSSLLAEGEETARTIKTVSAGEVEPFDAGETLGRFNKKGQNVMLMFDIDGTLTRRDEEPETKAAIKRFSKEVLEKLSKDRGFDVYLNTGKSRKSLEDDWNVDGIGYVAEHGALIKEPHGDVYFPQKTEVVLWLNTIKSDLKKKWTSGWPGEAKMSPKKEATISFIGKETPEFQLFFKNLQETLGHKALVTLNEGTLIEITRKDISKGTAVKRIMDGKSYTLALAAGDDVRDIEMFGEIRKQMNDKNVFSLIITKDDAKETKANFRLEHHHDLLRFLAKLAGMNFPLK